MNNLAQEIAQLLDRDPIMAAQVKEFITAERLCEVLNLPKEELAPVMFKEQIREAIEAFGGTAIAKELVRCKVPLSCILQEYNCNGAANRC